MWRQAGEQRVKSMKTQSGPRQGRQSHAAHAWRNELLELVRGGAPDLFLFFTFLEPSAKSRRFPEERIKC